MKKTSLVCLVLLVSCSGGGGSGGGGTEPGPVIIDQLKSSALASLEAGDIANAKDSYTKIIEGSDKFKADGNNSTARFGRAFSNILLLMERDPTSAILAGFGQSPWKLNTIFGENGYLAQSLINPKPDKSGLPFYNIKACKPSKQRKLRCILSKTASGYTAEKLAASLNELVPHIDEIISDLAVAIQDASASYIIPKKLYSGDADIKINHADMVQILAGMYLTKASFDFANSWKFDLDMASIVDANGNGLLSKQRAVNLLNSQFNLRSDNRLSSANTNLLQWANYSKQALDEVLKGSSGGVLNLSDTNKSLYSEMYDMVDSAIKSFGGDSVVAHIQPEITANLNRFFGAPPDASKIEMDPFVLEGTKIKAVEAFWQKMIEASCNFRIGAKGVKVFSETVRKIQYPYYSLFDTIMGHYFGKHKAGTKF